MCGNTLNAYLPKWLNYVLVSLFRLHPLKTGPWRVLRCVSASLLEPFLHDVSPRAYIYLHN
jgi:hypothetical protein